MSNVIPFAVPELEAQHPNAVPLILIKARHFLNAFRYSVEHPWHPDPDECPADQGILDTYSLEGARDCAHYWGKEVMEIGPPEAFRSAANDA
jgi:hypothetical protein